MSVVLGLSRKLTYSANSCTSESFSKPLCSLVEQPSFLSFGKSSQKSGKLRSWLDSGVIRSSTNGVAFSSSGVPAETASTSSARPANQNSGEVDIQQVAGQDCPNDAAERKSTKLAGTPDKVIISTTRTSKTARVLSKEPEYVSDRYVKGSLKYRIGLSESVYLGKFGTEVEPVDTTEHEERFSSQASSKEVASTSGDSGGPWRSKTYRGQVAKKAQKEVVLRFPTDNSGVLDNETPSKNVDRKEAEQINDETELHTDTTPNKVLSIEEELRLQQALATKRAVAAEILRGSLRAVQLSAGYTNNVITYMTPFLDRIVIEAVALKKSRNNKELSFNSRARLYISQCKVAQLVKWLKHMRMTNPRIGKLICIADENLGVIRSRVTWLKSIYVTGRDLGVVLERQPKILELSIDDLTKTVEILETAGVQRKWLGLVVSRSPKVLTISWDELHEKIKLFADLGVSPEKFGIMVFNFPAIIGHFSVEEMQSKVDYLRQIGMEDSVLAKIIASAPQLLACSIEDAWVKLLRYFYFLRIELAGVRRILAVNPSIFCLNVEENIAPKVKFLRVIGVHEESIGQVIVNFPAILTYSLDKKIRPVVKFLLDEVYVKEEKVGKVITMRPELIRCSLPNKLKVLANYFFTRAIRRQELGRMVEDFPALLMYSVPVVHPKFQYLTKVMKRPLADLVAFPRYFSYSLKTRIIPRHEVLKQKGMTMKLRYMLGCSDDAFRNRVDEAESGLPRGSLEEEAGLLEDEDDGTDHEEDEIDSIESEVNPIQNEETFVQSDGQSEALQLIS